MEYLNTCTLGLRLTERERHEVDRMGIVSWGEEKCRIALELCCSGLGDRLQERTDAIHDFLVDRMLQSRYAVLEKLNARIDQLTKGCGPGLEERRLLEMNYQIITSRAIHQLQTYASYEQISESLSQIGTMLSRVSCVTEAEFFSTSLPQEMVDQMTSSLVNRIRRSTAIFGRYCWEGRPDDQRIPIHREEVYAEMTRIENIQDRIIDKVRPLTDEEKELAERLVLLQEFAKELVF